MKPDVASNRRAIMASVLLHVGLCLLLSRVPKPPPETLPATSLTNIMELELQFPAPPLPVEDVPNAIELAALQPTEQTRVSRAARTVLTSQRQPVPETQAPLTSPEPTPPQPERPSNPNAANPFFLWRPGTRSARTTSTQGTAERLLSANEAEFSAAATRGGVSETPGTDALAARSGEGPQGATARAREASGGYAREQMLRAAQRFEPGATEYFRRASRAAVRIFRPTIVNTPTVLDTITRAMGREYVEEATRRSLGPLVDGRGYAATQDLTMAHPHSPLPQPALTMSARAAATASVTQVEVEVEQTADGRIRAMRVARRSGVTGFDRQALDAVRESIQEIPSREMPGGWRSRWVFEVRMSRDPIISALPTMPGEAPVITPLVGEVEFDEVLRTAELHAPGMLHRRTAVRVLYCVPLTAPTQ